MATASHTFHDFLQPSDAPPGSATPSSGSSSPEVFFDAPEHLPTTMLPSTPTPGLVNNAEEFHDAQEMPDAGVIVNIEDCRATHGLGDQEHDKPDSETGHNGFFNFDGQTEPGLQGDQRGKARRLLIDFLPKKHLSNNLREETRKIVQMLSNDKVCKIDRPSLGLQDRLQSLVQRSAGKRISYVKGPRVCSTLVKSIVKRTQDSMYLRRTSFQGYPGKHEERPPLPVFNKPVPSYAKPPKCTKAPERDGTPLRESRVNDHTSNANVFELVTKRRKQNNINEINSGSAPPGLTSPVGPFSTITYNNHNNTPHSTSDKTFTGENVHVTSTVDLSKSRRGECENDLISVDFKISVPYGDDDLDTPQATEHRPSFHQVAEDAESDEEMEFSSEEPLPDISSKDTAQVSTTQNLNTTGMLKDPPNKQTKMKETAVVSHDFPDVQVENSSNLTNGHGKQATDPPPAKSGSQVSSSDGPDTLLPTRQRGDSTTNGVIDLRKHIASLNKVSLTFGARNTEHISDDKNATATNDSPALSKPCTESATPHPTSEAKPKTVQGAAGRGAGEQVKSSPPGNASKFHTATAMANLLVPTYRGGQALERRLSPVSSSKSLQRSLSTLDLLYPDEDIPPSAANNALHIEALLRIKTDNLVARHGGKSNLHPYPTSPRQTSPAPAPAEPPTHKAAPESTSGKEKTEVTPDPVENLPPLPPSVQRIKRESISRQTSKEEDLSGQRSVSRNGSLEHPCLGSRRGSSHLLQRPGSRRGSKMQSFSQDVLRKCLIAAVDQCYNTEWEETSDSNVVRDDSMTQEEVNKSLVRAVCRHDAEKVRMMLKLGGDPNVKHNSSPVLLRAAREGALYVMQALLAAGADVDVRSDMGNSPLHLAARGGYSEVVVQLVQSGAFVDAINRSGVTPLQMALAHGHVDVARSLLRLNADMFLQNKVGETAYNVANDLGYIGLSGAPREIRRDSGVGTRVEPCSNDVPVAVRMIQGIEEGCAGTVDDCLREGASPNTLLPLALHWPAHASVLHRAAHHGHDLIVRLLLAAGADIHARDVVGNTPLHVATQAGHNRVVKILLDSGASLEAVSQSGMSPLHRAASKGKELTCNLLIRRGANPRAEDSSGRTPADWARKRDFKHLSQKLAHRRKSSNSLLAEGDGRLDLNHLHRLHEAALKEPRQQSPEPMECEE